jgi:hypothetical protein
MKQPTRNNIVLQDRDIALVRMLTEDFRILSREQIGELFPLGSVSRLNFRLKQLHDAGYLSSRPLAGLGSAVKRGYYLGPRAVELCSDPTEQRIAASARSEAAQLAPAGLAHRMLVDSIHIRFLTAARDFPNYKLLTWIDQYSSWWNEVRNYGIPVQADGYGEYLMLLQFDNLFTFFLEVDRGTEGGKAIQDKIARYIQYAESGSYERQFAAKPFRVLLITTGARRRDSLLKLIEARTDKIFWITSWEQFRQAKLLDRYWLRPGQEGTHSLFSHV